MAARADLNPDVITPNYGTISPKQPDTPSQSFTNADRSYSLLVNVGKSAQQPQAPQGQFHKAIDLTALSYAEQKPIVVSQSYSVSKGSSDFESSMIMVCCVLLVIVLFIVGMAVVCLWAENKWGS
ncbi:hypothetical protein [Parashewanella tropica]|uniref:hypothetical protein n=1 Tax=Parashewanella tropica TaxID=2547970 RepID=UPI00105A02C1|nr:hypothetical protein [Parashewanella tropica]